MNTEKSISKIKLNSNKKQGEYMETPVGERKRHAPHGKRNIFTLRRFHNYNNLNYSFSVLHALIRHTLPLFLI